MLLQLVNFHLHRFEKLKPVWSPNAKESVEVSGSSSDALQSFGNYPSM
jgi:hypothetical protein